MTRAEKQWVWIFASVVMGMTTVPYLIAYSQSGSQAVFTGFFFGVEDGNSYIAKMLSGSAGAWLFRSPYTGYPQAGLFAFFPYILLGKLAAGQGTHDQLVALYHLFRFAAGALDIFATYAFLALFVREIGLRRFGTFLAVLGGGLGWVLVLLGQNGWLGSLPLDFYSPETFGFLEIYGLPHLALARALLFFALVRYLSTTHEVNTGQGMDRAKPFLISGAFLLFAGIMQPLTALIGWIIIGFHQVIQWVRESRVKRIPIKRIFTGHWPIFWIYVISSPIIIYTAVVSILDPFMKGWTAQNTILSPNPLHYLVAFGLILAPALIGIAILVRRDFWSGSLLAGWAILFPVLAYVPYNLQRRLPEGIWVIWVTGALIFLRELAPQRRKWVQYGLLLALPSTLFLVTGSVITTLHPATPVYRPADEVKAFEFLASLPDLDPVVLASYETGNGLPAWAPLRVVIGHGPESIHLSQLRDPVANFYKSTTSDADRLQLIHLFQVSYIFRGPLEAQLGSWDPGAAPYLRQIYNQDGYSVYQVEAAQEAQ